GIADIDTRRLTRILRDKGSQNGAIVAGENATTERALELAKAFPGLKGMDLATEVTSEKTYQWNQTEWDITDGYGEQSAPKFKVAAWGYGGKLNILRLLAAPGSTASAVAQPRSAHINTTTESPP